MAKRILFLVPYPPGRAPSQRFRFEQYFGILQKKGWQVEVRPLINSRDRNYFLESGKKKEVLSALLKGLRARMADLFRLKAFDYIFIHREAFPVGPPFFEFMISRISGKKVIYDFDDAIWLSDRPRESFFFRMLKWRSRVSSICKWSYRISCGNRYLAAYALRHNPAVVCNPTTVDTEHMHNPDLYPPVPARETVTIGWTGSFSTLKYLKGIEHVLQRIQDSFPHVEFAVIADNRPELNVPRMRFIPWNIQTEISDLLTFDIGIMPLPDNEWVKGKCGFKILQYMALRIPAVASAAGVNGEIISHGENGFLCATGDDWYRALENLVTDKELRRDFGIRGRALVRAAYSVQSNTGTFLSLFE